MSTLIKNVRILDCGFGIDVCDDVLIDVHEITIAPHAISPTFVIEGRGLLLVPGLVDLHVHFREPGFIHKEDIKSGIRAALKGGVTSAMVMPNTAPALDCERQVHYQLRRAVRAGFNIMVAGAATLGLSGENLTDVESLKNAGVKALTDDGKPVSDSTIIKKIFRECRRHDLVFMQHAEDLVVSKNAPLHQGKVSERFHLEGQPASSESGLIARDIGIAEELDARYHVMHLSCCESLRLISKAKKNKVKITSEVTPHHLLLSECDVGNLDTLRKMNPPLRTATDKMALVEALAEGLIDAVASDHAPHAKFEKQRPFAFAPFGVVGLESAILVLLTLVKKTDLSLFRAIESMTTSPAAIVRENGRLGTMFGNKSSTSCVLLDPDVKGVFTERSLAGKSKNSPFIGMELYGCVMATFIHGSIVSSHGRLSERFYKNV